VLLALIKSCPTLERFNWFEAFNNAGLQPKIFHFPCDAKIHSFLFYCATDPQKKIQFGFISAGINGAMFFYPSQDCEQSVLATTSEMAKLYKIAVASLLYEECFPECVIQGPPEYIKHPSHHKYKSQQHLAISPKILQSGSHASPKAHFRSGHFRVLKSEKFKNKRFQVVFVSQTFVKGKAETILSPEQA